MRKSEGFRSADLSRALEQAVLGRREELYRKLELGSGLPGPRANLTLAHAFAEECARMPRARELAYAMAELPANEARGGSSREFLGMCGVLAVAACASAAGSARDRKEALALLDARADDLRFRVRDAVPLGLARLGQVMKRELDPFVGAWLDRYFHAAAVLRALGEPIWLDTFGGDEHAAITGWIDAAFWLAHDAPRSAVRYPGHKALLETLASAPKAVARRFGRPMFALYASWAEKVKVPELRDVILQNLVDSQMKKAFRDEIEEVRALVEKSKAPPRDPTILRQGMRSRGKKRSHD